MSLLAGLSEQNYIIILVTDKCIIYLFAVSVVLPSFLVGIWGNTASAACS